MAPNDRRRGSWGQAARLLALLGAVGAGGALGCKVKDPPPIETEWTDDFDRGKLGGDYYRSRNNYEIKDGVLRVQGAENHPMWLRKKMPRDVSVEFDAWSNTPDGDIKVEIFGDGRSHATSTGRYISTGYAVVMGGWNNSKSILAHGNEHGKTKAEVSGLPAKVKQGVHYHWKLVRQGSKIDWFVDDMSKPYLSYDDPAPLEGPGHEYFGFSNWRSDCSFDNLKITPL